MDALLPALVAALLAEMGDKTQLLALALGLHFRRPLPVLAGVALAALANMAIGAFAGAWLAPRLTHEAATLMLALALLFAAAASFWPQKPPPAIEVTRPGAFLVSFGSFFILELGDKTQFLTFAVALRSGSPWLALLGATAGVVVASMIAILAGAELRRRRIRRLRRVAGSLFLTLGLWALVAGLRLI